MQKKIYKILLAGVLNNQMESLYSLLSSDRNELPCMVQLCSSDEMVFEFTIKPMKPDLVILCLQRLDLSAMNIFAYLRRNNPETLIMTIGTEAEYKPFAGYIESNGIEAVYRPIEDEDILKSIYKLFFFSPSKGDRVPSVLFIDDDPVFLRTMRKAFKDKYDVYMATSGEEALFQLETNSPDVIFLDYEMPGMNGRDVLEKLRCSKAYHNAPVYILTGMKEREKIMEILELKPNGYFLKPVALYRLAKCIEESVGPGKDNA